MHSTTHTRAILLLWHTSLSGIQDKTFPHHPPPTPQAGPAPTTAPPEEPPLEPTYLHLFLLKYVCPQPGCFGTLAPGVGTDVFSCNICGQQRSEAQFLAELEQDQEQGGQG